MQMTKKCKKKKTINANDKKNKEINKQPKNGKIFLSSLCHMVWFFTYKQNVMPIVGTVSFNPVSSFH